MAGFRRLDPHPSGTVTVDIEGKRVDVPAGETVAAAVLVESLGYTRAHPISGAPRGPCA